MRLLVLVMSALLARTARGETIAVASTDPSFVTAITAALASAGLAVLPARTTWKDEITDLTGTARSLADDNHATAAIALIFGASDATLIAYDRALDRILLRVLPYRTPMSEAQSAEVARMARSMLRALRVTPDVDLPPPHAREAAAIRARAAAEVVAPPVVAPSDLLALELAGNVRFGPSPTEEAVAGVVVRPDALGGVVSAIVSPSTTTSTSRFMGTVSDFALAASARLPLQLAPRLTFAASAGFALHRARLAATADTKPIDMTHYDPALRVGVDLRYELRSGLQVGASASLEGLLRYQDYTVEGVQVADVPAARFSLGLSVLARIL